MHILKSVCVRMLLRVCVGGGGRWVVGRATVFGYAQSQVVIRSVASLAQRGDGLFDIHGRFTGNIDNARS